MVKESFDVILVDLGGNVKEKGVVEGLDLIEMVMMGFEGKNRDLRGRVYL